MCQNCEQIREQLKAQATSKDENRASNLPEGLTMVLSGNSKAVIKPFENLDDALLAADKVSNLLYPTSESTESCNLRHENALVRAAAIVTTAHPDQKFEALVALLGTTLMSFDPSDLEQVKTELRYFLETTAAHKIDIQTKEFIASSGLVTTDLHK